jgi:hypothetical protein
MRLRTILAGLFIALMFLHFGVHSYHFVSLMLTSSSPGWTLSPVDGSVRLTHGQEQALSAIRSYARAVEMQTSGPNEKTIRFND